MKTFDKKKPIKKAAAALKKSFLVFLAATLAITMSHTSVFAGIPVDQLSDYYTENEINYRDATACGGEPRSGPSLGGLDKFLQALAHQESGGVLGKTSPSQARGKYQYKDGTWQGVIRNNKMPWTQYKTANDAPESVQDAVAFIEYSKKAKKYKNDTFKMAVSHFMPAAVDNEALLDKAPANNNGLTPRKYGEQVQAKVDTEGPWSKIPLKYADAPGFDEALRKNGITPGGGGGSGSSGSSNGLKYIQVGTGKNSIPATGKKVGASTFGGRWENGEWIATNDLENPAGKDNGNEDPGIGNRDNKLPGSSAYAELSVSPAAKDFSALGDLPNGTRLAIKYEGSGKTVIAQKGDVGAGGLPNETKQRIVNGKPLAIDIFYDVARLLDFKSGSDVVTVRGVDPKTPLTPVGGSALVDDSDIAADNNCNQPCDEEGSATGDIVLDPGHSANGKQGLADPDTKLKVGDNEGAPGERVNMQKTADIVKKDLQEAGYRVVMTKEKANSPAHVGLRERAEIANKAKAALAVSLHYDGSHTFGQWGEIYAQEVGLSRYNVSGSGKKTDEKKFDNPDIAKDSQDYAKIFQEERTKSEGHKPTYPKRANFSTRGANYSRGNIPMVQLFSKVPWVYLEAGARGFDAKKYAAGITAAIKRIAKPTGAGGKVTAEACEDGSGGTAGSIVKTAISFAWPTRQESVVKPPRGYNTDPISLYAAALKKFGLPSNGRDCGMFVGSVMLTAGVDKKFPKSYTPTQYGHVTRSSKYVVKKNVHDSTGAQPGDIFIAGGEAGGGASGHILFWIGKGKKADASLRTAGNTGRTGGISGFGLDGRYWIRAHLK